MSPPEITTRQTHAGISIIRSQNVRFVPDSQWHDTAGHDAIETNFIKFTHDRPTCSNDRQAHSHVILTGIRLITILVLEYTDHCNLQNVPKYIIKRFDRDDGLA